MANGKPAAAPRAPRPRQPRSALPPLPPVTVARFEEAMHLIELLVDEQTDVFIAKGQEYRERHRAATDRRLTAQEAAQVASAMASAEGLPPVQVAVAVQESDLKAYDEPQPMEILLRAGVATAPEAMRSVQKFVALIEMDPAVFQDARESGGLTDALEQAVDAMAYEDMSGARGVRARTIAAFDHFAEEVGDTTGKAMLLSGRALWQAWRQGMEDLGYRPPPSSPIGSPPSMDGVAETSSTTPATPTR